MTADVPEIGLLRFLPETDHGDRAVLKAQAWLGIELSESHPLKRWRMQQVSRREPLSGGFTKPRDFAQLLTFNIYAWSAREACS